MAGYPMNVAERMTTLKEHPPLRSVREAILDVINARRVAPLSLERKNRLAIMLVQEDLRPR